MDLRTYLRIYRISQADFARRLGVTRSAVNQWLSRTTQPAGYQAARIVQLTRGEVTLTDLFPPESPPRRHPRRPRPPAV